MLTDEIEGRSHPVTAQHLTLDLIVVGFGKAGKTLAATRAAAGDKVALIEQDPAMYGGTCINIGCVPTKRLLTDAARGLPQDQAVESRNAFIAKLNAANKAMVEGKGVLVLDGFASFTGPKTLAVGDDLTLTAPIIVINTGAVSRAKAEGKIHNSTSIQQVNQTPASLAVVGAGPIGLEFATLYNSFGSQVTVYQGSGLFLPSLDPQAAAAVQAELEAQGISFEARRVEDPASLPQDLILLATGRVPALEGLNLEAAGVAYSAQGIQVDDHCRTSVPGIYAVGDCTGAPQFTYLSYDDYRVVLSDAWGDSSYSRTGRIYPTTTFTNPPLSQVGLTAQAAQEAGYQVEVREAKIADMAIVPRPKILGATAGFARFILDADTNQILGATLFCIDSQELINLVTLAIKQQIPAKVLGDGIYTHPSSSELFNALLA